MDFCQEQYWKYLAQVDTISLYDSVKGILPDDTSKRVKQLDHGRAKHVVGRHKVLKHALTKWPSSTSVEKMFGDVESVKSSVVGGDLVSFQAESRKTSIMPLEDAIRVLKQLEETRIHSTEERPILAYQDKAELIVLAKLTCTLHSHTTQRIMNSSSEFHRSLRYLYKSQMSPLGAVLSFLQTLPSRLYVIFLKVKQGHSFSQVAQLKQFFVSSVFEQQSLDEDIKEDVVEIDSETPPSLFKTTFIGLKDYSLGVFGLIRRELQIKTSIINLARQYEAGSLGLLNVRGIGLEDVQLEKSFSATDRYQCLFQATYSTLSRLDAILQKRRIIETLVQDAPVSASVKVEKMLKEIEDIEKPCYSPLAIEQLYARMNAVLLQLQHYDRVTTQLHDRYGKPSRWAMYWPHIAAGCLGIFVLHRKLLFHYSDIAVWISGVADTVKTFFMDWVVSPLHEIYKTVRHREARLALLGAESLNSDLDSLERMVVDLAKDQGVTNEADLGQITESVKRGDLTSVLKTYESQLKNPIQGALFGDLIRTLLIQIHKAKVDGELAMTALDKLLKSNELNFAVLAVIPSLLFISYVGKKVFAFAQNREQVSHSVTHEYIRTALREIERILTHVELRQPSIQSESLMDLKNQVDLPYRDHGLLLCEMFVLRKYAHCLPTKNGCRMEFLQDVRELERNGPLWHRIRIITRMRAKYRFLTF